MTNGANKYNIKGYCLPVQTTESNKHHSILSYQDCLVPQALSTQALQRNTNLHEDHSDQY